MLDMLIYACKKVTDLFDSQDEPAGHGLDHIKCVVKWARVIALSEHPGDEEVLFLSQMAAWFHDVGRTISDESHWKKSGIIVTDWFQNDIFLSRMPLAYKERILYAVVNHWNDAADDYPEAIILRDADKLDAFGEKGLQRLMDYHNGDENKVLRGLRFCYQIAACVRTKKAKAIMEENNLFEPAEKKYRELLGKKVKRPKLT